MFRRMWKAVETKARKIRVEKAKEKMRREQTEEERKERMTEVKKVAKEWEIWDDDDEVAKSEKETKQLVLERFHKWMYVFDKKASEKKCLQENYEIMPLMLDMWSLDASFFI